MNYVTLNGGAQCRRLTRHEYGPASHRICPPPHSKIKSAATEQNNARVFMETMDELLNTDPLIYCP